jgi:hypothetical protein
MFFVWAELSRAPGGIADAGSTLFSSDSTDADFADYAKSRGFVYGGDGGGNTEFARIYGMPGYYNPATETTLVLVAKHNDSDAAAFAAGCMKRIGPAVS